MVRANLNVSQRIGFELEGAWHCSVPHAGMASPRRTNSAGSAAGQSPRMWSRMPRARQPYLQSAPRTSGKAIVSLVCGLLFFVPLAFIAAIVFGHLGLSEIRRSAGRLKGEGMAIAGLVLGYLWIVGIPLILIVAAIAIPNLLRARVAANESSAVASIRSIGIAEIGYAQAHSNVGFTCSMSDLAGDRLISSSFAEGAKNGYAFELLDCSAGAEGAGNVKYRVVAYPARMNTPACGRFALMNRP
jgi:hypothetical protein